MLIDVHTHIFPSKIAPKTIKVLEAGFLRVQHKPYYAHTTGTGERRGAVVYEGVRRG